MTYISNILDLLYYLLTECMEIELIQAMFWICIMMIVIKFVKGVVWL